MALATQSLLNIVELLEQILLELHPKDILVGAQRVCRQWHQVITWSPRIQQLLYFRKIHLVTRDLPPPSNKRYVRNNIMTEAVPFILPVPDCLMKFWDIRLNPLEIYQKLGINPAFRVSWLRENASWRQMQIALPPITKLYWEVYPHHTTLRRLPTIRAEFSFPDGICMGTYYDLIMSTPGYYQLFWPEQVWPGPDYFGDLSRDQLKDPVIKWYKHHSDRQHKECALLLHNRIVDRIGSETSHPVDGAYPPDLQKYHNNIVSLKQLKNESEATYESYDSRSENVERSAQKMDTWSMMKEFITDMRYRITVPLLPTENP
ncbi:hypothetical protein F5Y11DRAFT_365899 [Daldinia sp. FL1419]|nr:hypothetical protein F5Y11DRAFT_365899 [Daldinia sp. FL1419]